MILRCLNSLGSHRSPARRLSNLVLVAVVAVGLGRVYLFPAPLRLSRETTHITSPRLPGGGPDFVAYLDSLAPPGVNTDTNAAVPLLTFVGESRIRDVLASHLHSVRQAVSDATLDQLCHTLWERMGSERPGDGRTFESLWESTSTGTLPAGASAQAIHRKIHHSGWSELTAAESDAVAQWLDSQSGALALLEDSAQRPHMFLPALRLTPHGGMPLTWLAAVGPLREAGVLLRLRAEQRLGQGDVDGAIEDALVLPRLLDRLAQDHSLAGLCEAISLAGPAASNLRVLLDSGRLTPQQRREFLERAQPRTSLADIKRAWSEAWRVHHIDFVIALREEGEIGPPNEPMRLPVTANINHYLAQLNRFQDRLEVAMVPADVESILLNFDRLEQECGLGERRLEHWNRRAERELGYYVKLPMTIARLQRNTLQVARNFVRKYGEFVELHRWCEPAQLVGAQVPATATE